MLVLAGWLFNRYLVCCRPCGCYYLCLQDPTSREILGEAIKHLPDTSINCCPTRRSARTRVSNTYLFYPLLTD